MIADCTSTTSDCTTAVSNSTAGATYTDPYDQYKPEEEEIPIEEDPYRLILKEEPSVKRNYFEIRNEPP